MEKKYPAKTSYGLLSFIFFIFFAPLTPKLISSDLNIDSLWLIVFLLLIYALILHMFLKTSYVIEHNELKIKCGLISFNPIKISDIKEISKTRNIISSPAPSFDRIEIKYGKFDEIILSPKNKLDFSNDLKKINPNIRNNITQD